MFIVDSDLLSRVTSYPADSTLRTCAELKKARNSWPAPKHVGICTQQDPKCKTLEQLQ